MWMGGDERRTGAVTSFQNYKRNYCKWLTCDCQVSLLFPRIRPPGPLSLMVAVNYSRGCARGYERAGFIKGVLARELWLCVRIFGAGHFLEGIVTSIVMIINLIGFLTNLSTLLSLNGSMTAFSKVQVIDRKYSSYATSSSRWNKLFSCTHPSAFLFAFLYLL